MRSLVLLVGLAVMMIGGRDSGAGSAPTRLRCEYRDHPLGLDVTTPRLSWWWGVEGQMGRGDRQTAYHVLVASDLRLLRPGKADLWDSGEVESGDSVLVPYGGRPLGSRQSCHWKVRVRDVRGEWSSWSEPAHWTMGWLNWESSETAEWIGTGESFRRGAGSPPPDTAPPDPWFRKTLVLDERVGRATAWVASIGYHELWINGRKVGDSVLVPSVTDHTKRARYVAYEIGDYLRRGTNVIGLWLGTSWSIFPKFEMPDRPRAPLVKGRFEVDLAGGRRVTVATDPTWKTRASSRTLLGVWDFTQFGGELDDANRSVPRWSEATLADEDWKAARTFAPKVELSADLVEPNRRLTEVKPVAIEQSQPGVYRFDMGRNFAGFIEFRVRGEPGDRIEMQISEQAGRAMTHRLRSVYVVGPEGRGTFQNRFNYGIGRWITVTGLRQAPALGDLRGWLVRSSYEPASSFECSVDLFNRIHDITLWTFENLSLGGYLVDCPHRERMGYGGDAHSSTTTGLMNFHLGALYTKWAQDWRDSQGRGASWGTGAGEASGSLEDGNLPYTAPTYWGGGGPGWCGYCVHLPWELWTHYGDRRALSDNFGMITRWLAFLETRQRDNLLRRWGGEWDFLGDWLWPGANGVNGDTRETLFFNNGYWIYNLQTASRIADVLGKQEQAALWQQRAETVRRAVHAEFFKAEDASYVDGSQAYLAMALVSQVPPESERGRVWRRLETEILEKRKGHIHAGITGGAFLFKALMKDGRDDLIYEMVRQETYPSWGDMLRRGATTLWESWEDNPELSYLHSSYLYVGSWFIRGVLGIRPDVEHPGFEHFEVRPGPVDRPDLTWARGHYDSVRGRISVDWRRRENGFELSVAVPAASRATVHLPAAVGAIVREGGQRLPESGAAKDGMTVRGRDGDRLLIDIGGGRYRFLVENR
ncbi:MAG: family 78 glycoside hydrolase catalytic domain [Verrucomicrobiales bacterium]|nr:family 78 glycoside hydrolase catalytic domain [Verrucomicrobiales bacterium]